ncbi:DUF2178 domain-containing protein [Granulicatella adiacens ATCC 49175]|uniref:DUF2178 domain-containing protein n=1 Tax=Granulicatella adiacens ATCC 49175 TaxID=638301 RepID=C8NHB0_9LACT|nr:hypothetical protein [Granulicatella adiacens]EEW37087.1 hypothetical protein HMPREF0444_1305 [Granulicatella adiacens ATCC 49175]UAK94370.1 DUF2178 domain-containing protein [Granulicatella adiacens]UWP38387.1 DUF2178 domain-containing protein [Granulicatella adiacens ATCC 49175]
MKTNKLWYLGYLVGICSLLAVFTLNLNEVVRLLLIFVSSISVSVSYVQLTHYRLLAKDRDYKISVNDERNEKIRDKVNATMSPILMILMEIIALVCIAVGAYIPAALLAISVGCSPIIMLFISKFYEQKY